MYSAEYLADNFDISKLTVPKIRSILVDHDVHFPSNANKSELINLFNTKIKPHYNTKLTKDNENSDNILKKHIDANENLIEPIQISSKDKVIPSKRHSSSEKTERTKKKRIRKYQNESFSDSTSNTDSFFEDSYNGNADFYSVTDKKYKKKPLNAEQLLAKIDQSTPGSSSLKKTSTRNTPSKISLPNTTTNSQLSEEKRIDLGKLVNSSDDLTPLSPPSPASNSFDVFFNNQRDEVILVDDEDTIDGDDVKKQKHSVTLKSPKLSAATIQSPIILDGPTTILKNSIIISSSDDEVQVEPNNEQKRLSVDENVDVSNNKLKSLGEFVEINSDEKFIDNKPETENDEENGENIHEEHDVFQASMESRDSVFVKPVVSEERQEKNELSTSQDIKLLKLKYFKNLFKFLFIIFVFADTLLVIFFAFCFREVRMNIGYCDVESPDRKIDIMQTVPSFLQEKLFPYSSQISLLESTILNAAQIKCKDCPDHAICGLNEIECEYGYRKTKSFKSLFGLVPLEEYCEYDFLKEEQNHYIINYTLKLLHRNNGKLSLEELHDLLKDSKPTTMNPKEFEEFWNEFVEKDFKKFEVDIDYKTKEIILSHKTPTEFYTRNYGTEYRTKKLFGGMYGLPTSINSKEEEENF